MSTFLVFPVLSQILRHDFEMFGYQSSAEWAVPVFVMLYLYVLGCACLLLWVLSVLAFACLCYTVPVCVGLCLSLQCIMLCLSLLHCSCQCRAAPVFVIICLSMVCCACLCCWAVPVCVTLCLIEFSCAGPSLSLCYLESKQLLTLIPLYNLWTGLLSELNQVWIFFWIKLNK